MKQKTVSTSVKTQNVRNETYCFENVGLDLVSLFSLACSVEFGFIVSHTVLKFKSAECYIPRLNIISHDSQVYYVMRTGYRLVSN